MKKPYEPNTEKKHPMRIALAGGGSGGPVTPLVAVAQELRMHHEAEFLLIGTNRGPERQIAAWNGIPFRSITAGKFRRYVSLRTLAAPFQSVVGFFQARRLLKRFKADVLLAAGGFVSVPVGYAAWSLKVPIVIHQQDIVPSMSNKLLAPVADRITTTFRKSVHDFGVHGGLSLSSRNPDRRYDDQVTWTGNPVRPEIAECSLKASADQSYAQAIRAKFDIAGDWPILLVFGGGTGASGLNAIVEEALPELVLRFEVIHATGPGKGISFAHERYHQHALVTNMDEAYAIADIVICRAGVGTISELAAAKKAAIVVPMPDSHQEENALYLHEMHAALIYAQPMLDGERLYAIASSLLYDAEIRSQLSMHISEVMPMDAAQKISQILMHLIP